MPSSRGSNPGPCIAGRFFTAEPPGKPLFMVISYEYSDRVRKRQYFLVCPPQIEVSYKTIQLSSVQSVSHVRLFVTPQTAACQAFLSITNSWSLLKLMSIESVMPSNHFILWHPLLLPPSIFPRIRVFSNQSAPQIRWSKYWSFKFSISPSNEYSGLISFRIDWLDLLAVQGTLKSLSNTTVQKHTFFGSQFSL